MTRAKSTTKSGEVIRALRQARRVHRLVGGAKATPKTPDDLHRAGSKLPTSSLERSTVVANVAGRPEQVSRARTHRPLPRAMGNRARLRRNQDAPVAT